MEGFMIARFGATIYSCSMIVVLISIIGAVLYVEKKLSHSSWHRNVLALIAGISIGLISLSIIYIISITFAPENSNLPINDLGLSLKNYFLFFVSEILISILVGYTAGKIVGQSEITYGFLVGLGMVLFLLVFGFEFISSFLQFNSLDLALSYTGLICLTTLGGCIALFQRERKQGEFACSSEAKSTF